MVLVWVLICEGFVEVLVQVLGICGEVCPKRGSADV